MNHELLFSKQIPIEKYLKAIYISDASKEQLQKISSIIQKKYTDVKIIRDIEQI